MSDCSAERRMRLKAGEWVEVRSVAEIAETLDDRGTTDGLPFMPQMLRYCGKRFQVRKRAHKLCDTAYGTGARKMQAAVFLEDLRCDGQDYDGCEMQCSIFWKEAWLKRAETPTNPERESPRQADILPAGPGAEDAEGRILAATRIQSCIDGQMERTHVCQATQILEATQPLPRSELRQYVEDYTSGNATLSQILRGLTFVAFVALVDSGLGFGSALRWMYDALQRVRGGAPYPSRRGHLPLNGRTPSVNLNLREGELVRIKSYYEILDTVDENLVNRGMSFHPEMVPHCGKVFRVQRRLKRIMNEKTGKLMELKNSCVVLEGADCIGRYTKPLNCPRASNPYWREVWLERAEPTPARVDSNDPGIQRS